MVLVEALLKIPASHKSLFSLIGNSILAFLAWILPSLFHELIPCRMNTTSFSETSGFLAKESVAPAVVKSIVPVLNRVRGVIGSVSITISVSGFKEAFPQTTLSDRGV